jgi:transcriptional regulator with XRE-family HTH domain
MDAASVARAMSVSRNYWSAVENERKLPTEDNLARVAELFQFEEHELRALLALRSAAKERGWWNRYPVIRDDVKRYYGLEDAASHCRVYEGNLVPGILQTPAYARALMDPDPTIRRADVDQNIEVRLKRQERLSGDKPLRLTALISEAVVRQEVGGPDVLCRQLTHIIEMTERYPDTIDIHVIPFTTMSCGLFGAGTVNILTFSSPRLPVVPWQETVTTSNIVEDPAQVRDITTTYAAALRAALSTPDSLDLLRRHAAKLSRLHKQAIPQP